ncbi:MAG TPA: ABC transporter permease, partial [Planctomycetota bacterium]|nr:ABC transporter permease [Planctomycetota bacterium]
MGTVLRRLLAAIPLLWGVSTLLFLAIHALPGDVSNCFLDPDLAPDEVAQIRSNLGLEEGLGVQYARWLRSAALLDFQLSLRYQRPVSEILGEVLPNTLLLSGVALLLAFGGGIAAGLFAARREGALPDRALGAASILLYSTPGFWLALMLLFLFAEKLAIFPTGGLSSPNAEFLSPLGWVVDRARHLVLPSVALACALGAAVFRFVRASLREALAQEYCRAARARGIPEALVLPRHALRNALLPV